MIYAGRKVYENFLQRAIEEQEDRYDVVYSPDVPPGYAYLLRPSNMVFIPNKEKRMTESLKDLVLRAVYTAGEVFLAVLVLTDVSTIRTAAVAAAGAAISVVKTWLAGYLVAKRAASQ